MSETNFGIKIYHMTCNRQSEYCTIGFVWQIRILLNWLEFGQYFYKTKFSPGNFLLNPE